MFISGKNKARAAGGSAFVAVLLMAFLVVPSFVSASNANRVFYTPLPESFMPTGSYGNMIPEGYGKGINKLFINAGPQDYDVYFTINNTNESGRSGTTFFETRKGPGNVDLSPNVALSATPGFADNATNTLTMDFTGKVGNPLYVRVHIPACGSDGTFRIQAHPGGTAHQGNGPGVVVFVNCNGYVPPAPPTPATTCFDYYGNPIACP